MSSGHQGIGRPEALLLGTKEHHLLFYQTFYFRAPKVLGIYYAHHLYPQHLALTKKMGTTKQILVE